MAALITEDWTTGARIGRYEILSKIAAGGMATVYLGRAHGAAGFERLVALKLCHPHLLEDEQAVERFLAEARLAARIHHPNVVATLDVVQEPTLCIAMEYVEGGSLASLIVAARDRGERIPPPLCLRVLVDLLAGLHAAHSLTGPNGAPLHLVHRDVTPQNVLVGSDGVARIADFGILKIDGQPSHTAAGNVRGKLPYLAPEQFEPGPLSHRVDVYAAGVVLWEALAGARLFQGDDLEVADQILRRPRPALRERVPELAEELEQVIARAMERDPAKRFASAADFSEALEKLPIPVASTRELAGYVNELLSEQLASRRVAIQHATSEVALPEKTQVTEPGAHAEITDEDPVPARTEPGALLPTAIVPAQELRRAGPTAFDRPRRSSRGLWIRLALVAAAVAAIVVMFTRSEQAQKPPEPVQVKLVQPVVEAPKPLPAPSVERPVEPPAKPVEPVREAVAEPERPSKPAEPVHHSAPRPHHKPKPSRTKSTEHTSKPFDPDTL